MLKIKKNWDIIAIVVILFSAIIIYQIFTSSLMFKLESDYDSNLPIYAYIFQTIKEKHYFPLTNPFIGDGFPVLGDPSSAILHPLAFLSFIIGGLNTGTRIIIYSSMTLSALTMYIVLKKIKYPPVIRIWAPLIYAFGGGLASRIFAGHLEKILSYPVFPVVLYLATAKKLNYLNSIILGICFSLIFLSGDIYSFYLLLILITPIRFYFLITSRKELVEQTRKYFTALAIFLLLSSIKIINFILFVKPNLLRYFFIDPVAGSINPFYAWILYIIPVPSLFSNASFLNTFFKMDYNWHEYYLFIGFIPLIFCIRAFFTDKKRNLPYIIMFILGLFYVGLNFNFSPFFWINKINPLSDNFRVPARMLFVMTPIIIFLASSGIYAVYKKSGKITKYIIIAALALDCAFVIFQFSKNFMVSLEPVRQENIQLIQKLKSKDHTSFDTASFTCCYQLYLIQNNIKVINYYYGWRMKKGHPNYMTYDSKYFDISQLWGIRPKYLFTGTDNQFKTYDYTLFLSNSNTYIWIDNKYLTKKEITK